MSPFLDPGSNRDAQEVEALIADRYLDALLDAGERHAHDVPADAGLDPGLRSVALALHKSLVRVHPSFRFEERLAARLQTAAAGAAGTTGASATSRGDLVPFRNAGAALEALEPRAGDPAAIVPPERPAPRPILVGGAITSAALSLAGVAWVAWRATRPAPHPMTRAARAAHRRAGALSRPAGVRLPFPGNTGRPA
jgi:hypothetical protein